MRDVVVLLFAGILFTSCTSTPKNTKPVKFVSADVPIPKIEEWRELGKSCKNVQYEDANPLQDAVKSPRLLVEVFTVNPKNPVQFGSIFYLRIGPKSWRPMAKRWWNIEKPLDWANIKNFSNNFLIVLDALGNGTVRSTILTRDGNWFVGQAGHDIRVGYRKNKKGFVVDIGYGFFDREKKKVYPMAEVNISWTQEEKQNDSADK